MSIAFIEAELKTRLAAAVTGGWPIRWANDPWAPDVILSEGNAPLNPDGTPRPYVEAEVIVGADTAYIAPEGQRLAYRLGLLRIYLVVGQNTGREVINQQADAIWPQFKRKTIQADASLWERLTTMDPRVDDNVAGVEKGDRYVKMITVPWEFYYRN